MALLNFQKLLFAIYTKKTLRDKFLLSPEEIAKEYGLEKREIKAISSLPSPLLISFAHSLTSKKNEMLKRIHAANPKLIVASSSYRDGPVISFPIRNGIKIIKIEKEEFKFLKKLPEARLNLYALFKTYLANDNVKIANFIRIALIISRSNIWNRKIRIL